LFAQSVSKIFNPCGHDPPTSQTDGQTTCDRKTALCTIVHRAVKTKHLVLTGRSHGELSGRFTAHSVQMKRHEMRLDEIRAVWTLLLRSRSRRRDRTEVNRAIPDAGRCRWVGKVIGRVCDFVCLSVHMCPTVRVSAFHCSGSRLLCVCCCFVPAALPTIRRHNWSFSGVDRSAARGK